MSDCLTDVWQENLMEMQMCHCRLYSIHRMVLVQKFLEGQDLAGQLYLLRYAPNIMTCGINEK